jgi:hypothetical protein
MTPMRAVQKIYNLSLWLTSRPELTSRRCTTVAITFCRCSPRRVLFSRTFSRIEFPLSCAVCPDARRSGNEPRARRRRHADS